MTTPDVDQFYVYADSLRTDEHRENDRNKYTYKLKSPVELRGEWVVGLAEITMPKPDGFDIGFEELIDPDLSPLPVISNPPVSPPKTPKKSPKKRHEEMMQVFYEVGDQIETQVVNMGAQLETQVADNTLMALPDFDESVYVECDICDNNVGEKNLNRPMLRRVHLERPGFQREFTHIHYIPVKKHDFDEVKINIKKADGSLVSFAKGLSMCTLHFVRKHAP